MSDQSVIERLCRLSHATSLQQICDMSYEILGNPIHISNMAHDILAYTKVVSIDEPNWQSTVVENQRERGIIDQSREVNAIQRQSVETRMPVLVTDGKVPVPRLIKALTSEGQTVGIMVVSSYLRPFEEGDAELVDLISCFVLNQLMKERGHALSDERTAESFFISLLDGGHYSRARAEKRLEQVGYAKYPYLYVLSLCLAREEAQLEDTLQPILNDFLRLRHCTAFVYNSTLICVYGSESELSDWENQAPELTDVLERWELAAGVSRRVTAVECLKDYYEQSLETLRTGRRLKRLGSYHYYDNLSSFFLFRLIPEEELRLYCHQKIQELRDYDRVHNTELCATLQVYLEQTKSLVRTAEHLFIHRNTVRYRINKCMEVLDSELNDGNEIFSYILSLRILEYQAKILKQKND